MQPTTPESFKHTWDVMCNDLKGEQKKSTGYMHMIVGIGLPDVIWQYIEDVAAKGQYTRDEIISRMLIVYSVQLLQNPKAALMTLDEAARSLKELIRKGKLAARPVKI